MRIDRSYRQALSYAAAMAELLAASRTQLDPALVSALTRVLERDERRALAPRSTRVAPRPGGPDEEAVVALNRAATTG